MKKHLNRLILLIGLVFLIIAIAIMMAQTIGRKRADSGVQPVSFHFFNKPSS